VTLDKQADLELMNWARAINDAWLSGNLGFSILPTSEDYHADSVSFDEPEPARVPADEIAANTTTDIVVQIGLYHFDAYRVLVHWYPRLMMLRRRGESINRREALQRLSKHMHTSVPKSRWLLEFAVKLYAQKRLTRTIVI